MEAPEETPGMIKVGSNERKVVATKRKTKEGRDKQKEAQALKKKNELLFKANLKDKAEGSEGDEWESVEEDFPGVKIEDLLADMTIQDEGGAKAEQDGEEFKE